MAEPMTNDTAQDSRLEGATSFLEGVIERVTGPTEAPDPIEAPEPAQTRNEPEPQREAYTTAEPERPRVTHEDYRDHVRERIRNRDLRRVESTLEKLLREAEEREQRPKEEAAKPDPTSVLDDPEESQRLLEESPDQWYRLVNQRSQDQILERLSPVIDYVQRETETRQQFAERVQFQEQQRQEQEGLFQELAQGGLFLAEREGWNPAQRAAHVGRVEFLQGSIYQEMLDAGHPPEEAARLCQGAMGAMIRVAQSREMNPALYLDRMANARLQTTMEFLHRQGFRMEVPAEFRETAPPPPQVQQFQQQKRQAQQIHEAGVGGSLAQNGRSAPDALPATAPGSLRAFVMKHSPNDPKAGIKEALRRVRAQQKR